MRLLVAPWGNPNWDCVDYLLDGEKVRSRTSLTAIQRSVSPDKTVIIVLDTLAERGTSYDEIEENVRERVERFAEENGLERSEVVVAPGVGRFENGRFEGRVLDYYHYVLFRLARELACDEELEVHLDLTHGINFMPVLTHRALKELLGIASIFKDVRFVVYNSDPYCRNVTKELRVNKLEDHPVRPELPSNLTENRRPLDLMDLSDEERRLVYSDKLRILREVEPLRREETLAFMGGLYNGLPLSLYTFFVSSDVLMMVLMVTLEVYRSYIEVSSSEKGLIVRRRVGLGSDFRTYALAYLTSWFLERMGVCRKRTVCLSEIDRLRRDLFKFDDRFNVVLQKEVRFLKEVTENKSISIWTPYSKIVSERMVEGEGSSSGPDKRNFLAHGGLERNVIEVMKERGCVLLRYSDDHLGTVKELSKEGLKIKG